MAETISPELFRQRLLADEELRVIDTRPADVFEEWHIPGTRNYPYAPGDDIDLEEFRRVAGLEDAEPIVTICGKGIGSYDFAAELDDRGIEDVEVVQDGMIGWSRLYELAAIPTVAASLEIFQVQRVGKGCLGYVVGAPTAGEAVVVDPTRHLDEFRRVADDDDMTITHVIDTHVHADHLTGGPALAEETEATYHLPAAAAERDVEVEYEPLARNEVLTVGTVDLKAIHTPGHTAESMSLLVGAEAVLTGDTLFVDGVGRTELQFGDAEAGTGARRLYDAIHGSILSLPDAVTILPGHFATDDRADLARLTSPIQTTVGEARTDLPLLQLDREAFVETIVENVPEKPPNYARMIAINSGRDVPEDAEEATDLELGPNRCAVQAD